jgi:5,10-methenyltetrahydromethanopterin hydrogenase
MKAQDLGKANVSLFNPRRDNFPINDPNASKEQIKWEFDALADADMIIFWFSRGSLNPIVLYELGMWGNSRDIPIVIGIDDGYERRQDVEIQTELAREDVLIVDTLDEVVSLMKQTVEEVWE